MPSFSQIGWPQLLAPGTLSQTMTLKLVSRKHKNRTKYKLKSSTCRRRHSNNNKRRNGNRFVRFSEHFRQNCPLGTLKMTLRASRFQNFLGEKIACENIRFSSLFAAGETSTAAKSEEKRMCSQAREKTPRPPKRFTRSALAWFVDDWKISRFYILKRLESLD